MRWSLIQMHPNDSRVFSHREISIPINHVKVRIWTPPVLQAKITVGFWVRLHTYIRPVNELKGSGHNGLFAHLLLIAFTCSMAQRTVQVLQTPVRPVHH